MQDEFDPDAFLAQEDATPATEGDFDPDAFLAQEGEVASDADFPTVSARTGAPSIKNQEPERDLLGDFVSGVKNIPNAISDAWDTEKDASMLDRGRAVGEAAFEGVTQGLSDEITGGLASLVTDVPYDTSVQTMKDMREGAMSKAPVASSVSEIASGLWSPTGKILKGATAVNDIRKGVNAADKAVDVAKVAKAGLGKRIVEGAGDAGVAGYGYAEGDSAGSDAAKSAGLGGAMTGVFGALGKAGKATLNQVEKVYGKHAGKGIQQSLDKVYSRIGTDFDKETADFLSDALVNKDSVLRNAIKERYVDVPEFLKLISEGNPEAIKMATKISSETSAAAGRGVRATTGAMQDDIAARSIAETQEAGTSALAKAQEDAALAIEKANLATTGSEMVQDFEAKAASQKKVVDATKSLKDAETSTKLATEQFEKGAMNNASEVGKRQLTLSKELNKKAADLNISVRKQLAAENLPNAYTPEVIKETVNDMRDRLSSVSGSSEDKAKILKAFQDRLEDVSKDPDMATAWSKMLSLRADIPDMFRNSTDKRVARMGSDARGVVNDLLYSGRVADIPEAQLSRELFVKGYDAQTIGRRLTKAGVTGRNVVAAPNKAKALLKSEEDVGAILNSVAPEDASIIRQASDVTQTTPTQKKVAIANTPAVQEADAAVGAAKQGSVEVAGSKVVRQADKTDKKIDLTMRTINKKLEDTSAQIKDATNKNVNKLTLDTELRHVQNAVGDIQDGVMPKEAGIKAVLNGTGLTMTDIKQAVKTNALIKDTDKGYEALQEAGSMYGRGNVVTDEIYDQALAAAKIAKESPDSMKQAKAILTGKTSNNINKKNTLVGSIAGTVAALTLKVPMLGSALSKEVNKALKSDSALEVLTAMTTAIKIAEERNIKLNSPTFQSSIRKILNATTGGKASVTTKKNLVKGVSSQLNTGSSAFDRLLNGKEEPEN